MDKSQLYWLFLDFIGGNSIEIEGLYLKPERILRDGNTIKFSIDNPNDISFYFEVVKEHLDDILFDFSKFTNHRFNVHIDTNYPALYFNETLKNEIKRVLQSITTLKLSHEYYNYTVTTEIQGHSVGFNTEYDNDSIFIWNEFDAKSGKVYNETTNTTLITDLGECISNYLQIIEFKGSYLESDEVYQELDSVLEEYPLISTDWIVQIYHTGFKNLS
jgi:hypothetical protein